MTANKPATPLPWSHFTEYGRKIRTRQDFGDGVGNLVAETALQEGPQDAAINAAFIVRACNQYPVVVKHVQDALKHLDAGRNVHATKTLNTLLRELGEG